MNKKTNEEPRDLSGEVIDLSARTQILPTDLNKIKVDLGKGLLDEGYSHFLTEVDLGNNLHACYFNETDMLEKDLGQAYYELAWLRIPDGFRYVNYEIDEEDNVIVKEDMKATPLTYGLLAPLMLLSSQKIVKKGFHFCEVRPQPKAPDGSPIPTPYDYPKRGSANECVIILAVINYQGKKTFPVFYYNGNIRNTTRTKTSDTSKHRMSSTIEVKHDKFFLIPLIVSERIVVYYVIKAEVNKKNISKKLTEVYKKLKEGKNGADVKNHLVYNDKEGIYTTNTIEQKKHSL